MKHWVGSSTFLGICDISVSVLAWPFLNGLQHIVGRPLGHAAHILVLNMIRVEF